MFVNDFVALDRPALAVVDGFMRLQPALGPMVLAAWQADQDLWAQLGLAEPDYVPHWPIQVEIGSPRMRPDAVVIALHWRTGDSEHRVALEADLEIAAYGSNVTHLHLLGRYAFPPSVQRWSAEANRAHRATIAAIRRLLQMMADELTEIVDAAALESADESEPGERARAIRSAEADAR